MVTPIVWIDVKGSVWRRLSRQPLFRGPLPGDGLLEDGVLLNVGEALSRRRWHQAHPVDNPQGGLDTTRLTRGHWDFGALRLKWWPLEMCELTIEQSVLRHRSNVLSTPWPSRRRGKSFKRSNLPPLSVFPSFPKNLLFIYHLWQLSWHLQIMNDRRSLR